MADPQSMYPKMIRNFDCVYLADKTARYAFEIQKCGSSDLSFTSEADMERMLAYLGDLTAAIKQFQDQPQLDRTESHPMDSPVEAFPVERNMESDELDHVVRLLRALYVEIVNSQSSRMGNGLHPADPKRWNGLIEKSTKWLTDYVKKRQPMDLPESSPMEPGVTAGNLGIEPGAA